MATNGIDLGVEKSVLRTRAADYLRSEEDSLAVPRRPSANGAAEPGAGAPDTTQDFVRGLVVAVKELEQHIASETRKVGDAVDRRLDAVQASIQDLAKFVVEQQSLNTSVQDRLETLSTGLADADTRQTAAVDTLRAATTAFSTSATERMDALAAAQRESDQRRETEMAALSQSLQERIEILCKDLGVQQEDLAAIKTALAAFSTRTEALAERLDRQAEAVRSMYTAYSQRETELEQLVDGLARLRAFPAPMPTNGL
jgi:chromosome segregation ATPase